MDANSAAGPPAGSIAIEAEGDRRVLVFRGNVDSAAAAHFQAAHGRDRVVVDAIDAGSVTFISSSGISLMVMYLEAAAAAGRRPVLRSASREVEHVLRWAGLADLFPRAAPGEEGGGDPPSPTPGGGDGRP
jgi:anti-anti-sigma factor